MHLGVTETGERKLIRATKHINGFFTQTLLYPSLMVCGVFSMLCLLLCLTVADKPYDLRYVK